MVAHLSSRCPTLAVLATSRLPLRISGETVFAVDPLASDDEAAALFIDRAAAVAPRFDPDGVEAETVREVCRRLDGLPLAIELAASWIAVMSPAELLPMLEKRFEVLTGGARDLDRRQQTLRAAVDWSHDLLEAEPRTLFRRLSVFRGSFSREAAEEVGSDAALPRPRVLRALSTLCEASMVVAETAAAVTRYRLLETLRDYASERLVEAGEVAEVRERHLGYFTARAERAFERRMAGEGESVVGVLAAERDDVRHALDWARATDPQSQMRLAATLVEDVRRSLLGFRETRDLLAEALARVREPSGHRARALLACGFMAMAAEEDEQARRMHREACSIYEALRDREGEGWARLALGQVAWLLDDLPAARRELTRSCELFERASNLLGAHRARLRLGMAEASAEADSGAAKPLLERVVSDAPGLGDPFGLGLGHAFLGWDRIRAGDREAARTHFHAAARVLAESGEPVLINPIEGLALCLKDADVTTAARLLGFSRATRLQHGLRPYRGLAVMARAEMEVEAAARVALGDAALGQAEREGRTLPPDEALRLALGAAAERATRGRRGGPGNLTARELEVARLVASGLTYREIAAKLFLSVRTVEKHVDNIVTALGVRGRVGIAAWLHTAGLADKGT
jgi:non-specific serine/threonine protein kinase